MWLRPRQAPGRGCHPCDQWAHEKSARPSHRAPQTCGAPSSRASYGAAAATSSAPSPPQPQQQALAGAPGGVHPAQLLGSYETFEEPPLLPPEAGMAPADAAAAAPQLIVFSGGTAWNSVAGSLRAYTTRVLHVLPVSDDGGSTAEIVRVIGGPAVGDIRSRCLRLSDDSNEEARAVRRLLAHRLPALCPEDAKAEWYRVVEGEHPLWAGVSDPYKHTIRAFLVHFHTEILRHSSERFNFQNGSVGNFFFAGARIFFRSLDAAIFLFSRVARIPEGSAIVPAIAAEERVTLGAQLEDGSVIRGQNEISHPTFADSPCAHLVDKVSQLPPLPSPVRRIFYLSHEGTQGEHEVQPPTNRRVLAELGGAAAVVYAMGSLYTSIGPNLVLQGMGEAVAASRAAKLLCLNGSHDRETGHCARTGGPMAASDVVEAVCGMLNRAHTRGALANAPGDYVHTVLFPAHGQIEVDARRLEALGVRRVVQVPSQTDRFGRRVYDADALVAAIRDIVAAAAHADGPA